MADSDINNVGIPIHLDAFVLSPGSCDGESSIAPYTQPNYTSLRLDSHLIQHDVLDHVDFHLSSPAWKNPRLADLGRSAGDSPSNANYLNRRQNRMGVHLSWSLPRLYRSAQASGKRPKTSDKPEEKPNPNPIFRPIPDRWLVVRHIKDWNNKIPLKEWQSWIVESNAVRNITDITDPTIDIESDMAPFVRYHDDPKAPDIFRSQTEVFLGQKFDLAGTDPWTESKAKDHSDELTIMSSSNPLFADSALQNTNVLSMIDNFAYMDGDNLKYHGQAECDYFVLGWHSNPDHDPLNNIPSKSPKDLASRLSGMLLQLGETNAADPNIANDERHVRSLVHGAIYGVKYDINYNPNDKSPEDPTNPRKRNLANESAHKFAVDVKMEPLSVGTTPLDAMLTFLEAHEAKSEATFGEDTKTTVDLLLSIAQLLYAAGDNNDSRIQAQDVIAQQNFSKIDGGNKWIFAEPTRPGQAPIYPDLGIQKQLVGLNEAQTRLDTLTWKLKSLQWQLFAEWWKIASKSIPLSFTQNDKDNLYRPISTRASTLASLINDANNHITEMKQLLSPNIDLPSFKQTTNSPFNSKMDPTLCIAGLDSGWPKDWDKKLTIRLHSELANDDGISKTILAGATFPIPMDKGLDKTARKILTECVKKSNTDNGADKKGVILTDGRYEAPNITGFQSWGNRVPFVPLYIEWEGMYYHIGPMKDKWDVELRASPVGHGHPAVRYTPKDVLSEKSENYKDFRTVSGRVMVLPQPVFSLQALVMQVLDDAANESGLDDADKALLRTHIQKIQFISAPLSGLTNHLLTRVEGAHVKPCVRVQGDRKPTALSAAVQPRVGIDAPMIELIDAESALTPYGDMFSFSEADYPHAPFKPVTHGQMILTKLNVIDKFGQAICMPRTLRRRRAPVDVPTSNVYPCMSDYLSPDIAESSTDHKRFLNTVLVDPKADVPSPGKWPPCQYMQLTPSINQNARINGSFLVRDTIDIKAKKYTTWCEATDYSPMIWGWVIINYADNGLQLFLGDGRFYAEVRKGGVEGTTVSAKWLPYDKPTTGDDPQNAQEQQLSELLQKLRDKDYFQRFADMINGSIVNMPFPPSDYSGYANAIVGKPLALVNVGWSLEIAEPAIKSQNSQGKRPAWEGQVNDDLTNMKPTNPSDPNNQDAWKARVAQWQAELRNDFAGSELSQYAFPLKIGDIERNYDGVVGYWLANNDASECATKWYNVYTYFAINWSNLLAGTRLTIPTNPLQPYTVITGDTLDSIAASFKLDPASIRQANQQIPSAQPISDDPQVNTYQAINPHNFLQILPFYLDPLRYKTTIDLSNVPSFPPTTPGISMLADRATKYTVTPMLIDPYTAIHAYSPILPIKKLQLPTFAIQKVFEKMHAFFHLGPLLLTKDMPHKLEIAKQPGQIVKLPVSGRKGTWNWFQPYATDKKPDDEGGLDPTYAQMEIQEDLWQEKYVKGPYTFVEGFLQLMGSLEQKKQQANATVGGH